MKCLFSASLMFVSLLLASCTANYVKKVSVDTLQTVYLMDSHKLQRSQSFVLHRASKIYLKSLNFSERSMQFSTPAPAHPRQQQRLEQELLQQLRVAFPHTIRGEPGTNLQDAFVEATAMSADYLVYPWFAEGENRLNSGREMAEGRGLHKSTGYGLDDALFSLVIFDVHSRRMLDAIQVNSTVRWFASNNERLAYLEAATKVAVQDLSSLH